MVSDSWIGHQSTNLRGREKLFPVKMQAHKDAAGKHSSEPFLSMERFDPLKHQSNTWLKRFMAVCSFQGLSDERSALLFGFQMEGAASEWYYKLKACDRVSLKRLQTLLLKQFPPENNKLLQQTQLMGRKQGQDDVHTFSLDIQSRCQALDFDDDKTMMYLIQGLEPKIQAFVIAKDPKSLQDAVSMAKLYESIQSMSEETDENHIAAMTRAEETCQETWKEGEDYSGYQEEEEWKRYFLGSN